MLPVTAARFVSNHRHGKLVLILKTKEDDFANGKISAKTLCRITSLTDQRHRQLAQAGCFPPPKRGHYQLEATIQGLLRYYRERNNKEKASLSDEKFKKLQAERKMAELQLAKAEDKALDADAVVREWQNICLTVRQRFLGLDGKISPQLGFTDRQRAGLRREIEESLTELSKPQSYIKADEGDGCCGF